MTDLFDNTLFHSLLLILFGSIITTVISLLSKRTGVLVVKRTSQKLGISASDKVFGDVTTSWKDNQLRNLYLVVIDIENSTLRDYENVGVRVYSHSDSLLLSQRTQVLDTPEFIPFCDEFAKRMEVSEGHEASESQRNEYLHSRIFNIPVLNRSQVARFSFLATKPNDDEEPNVFVSCMKTGVRLKQLQNPQLQINSILGAPVMTAVLYALILCAIVIVVVPSLVSNIWLSSAVCMFLGLTGQIWGAFLYRGQRWVLKSIAG